MKMKKTEGHLVISAYGAKTDNFDSFPLWMKSELKMRLTNYLNAPLTNESPNETSISYFEKHFEQYLNGDQFPLEAKLDITEREYLEMID